ncbi:MAG TPA: succinylglutamate desuccinylase/aspartoacylase family protein [Bacillota bacterium]|nr:succinylglutamate desuccinylase/aspartoacylase family protein [Bacillota bacterium]HOA15391.1 succinylglutamate desuccinylase/aspartoacylase family protein [Bacillota bacterium]HOG53038.1 succinylglutamate desuccinylase/aspartoacylase family protein [Bacillota bacterium]
MSTTNIRKLAFLVLFIVLAGIASAEFKGLRHYKEKVVVSEAFTERRMLSDWLPSLKNTWGDTPVYFFDSGNPGATVLIYGGAHPYEPAGPLAVYVIMENLKLESGRIILIPRADMSASTQGILGNAYPQYLHIPTEWGQKVYRIGDRETALIDQWPDPFTYVHYPSGQNLAYQDLRNFNRTFPGRANGTLTERMSFAFMELIRKEKVDLTIDFHEASLMYPVVDTYVTHQRAEEIAMLAAMMCQMEMPMKCEVSPKSLRGLTHREIGDYSDTLVVLIETAEPFIDRVVGRVTEQLMIDGKDEFLQRAADKGLLYTSYDINEGISIDHRVARLLTASLELINMYNQFHPDKAVNFWYPRFTDVKTNGLGTYLHDPAAADPARVFDN